MHKLYFDRGSLKGKTVELAEKTVILGRGVECEIQLIDEGVSRQHCRIEQREGGVFLSDMDSTNGVFVNGEKVKEQKLNAGDYIKIGSAGASFDEPVRKLSVSVKPSVRAPLGGAGPSVTRPAEARTSARPSAPSSLPVNGGAPQRFPIALAVAIGAGVLSLLLFIWALTLQGQVNELKRTLQSRPAITAMTPSVPSTSGNVVAGRDASVEKLRQEVESLKQQLQQFQQIPPDARAGRSPLPPIAAVPAREKQTVAAKLPQHVRIVQIERDDTLLSDAADERIGLALKVQPQLGDDFDEKAILVEVSFYEQISGGEIVPSAMSPKTVLRPDAPWRNFTAQRLHTYFIVPKGQREREKSERGETRRFFGFVARVFYKGELQDEVVRPAEFPPKFISQR